jgi:protein O-mannosyl-transferase
MQLTGKRAHHILLAAATIAMLAAIAVAYIPGLHGPFMFDDFPNIVNNTALRINNLSPHNLLRAAFSSHSGVLYRPISMLSFAFNLYFFGDNSFSFKLTNLIIHLINTLLILWLTRRLLLNCRRRYNFDWHDLNINWASMLIAAAWALHPLNLTSVLFIVQRMTELAASFILAAIFIYAYGRERTLAGKTGWPLVWLLTPVLGIIALFCKEDAALLPLYLLVIEWLIFGFRNGRQKLAKNIVAFYACGLLLPGALGVVFLLTHPGYFLGGYAGRDFSLLERVLTEFRVVFLYVKWTFIPDIQQLALYHDDIAISTGLLSPITTLCSLLALVAILVFAWRQRKRCPMLCLGILFFFVGQMMESTILPLEIAFEHRNYLPDYGLLLALFSLLLLPPFGYTRRARISLRWAIAVAIIPVLFMATLLRSYEWRSFLDFGYYEVQHHPRSERALYVLGQSYSNLVLSGDMKDPAIAFHTLERAAAINTNIMPDVAMMIVSAKLERPVSPAWEKHAELLLLTHPVGVQDTTSLASLVDCLPTDCGTLIPVAHELLETAFQSTQKSRPNPDLWTIYANYLTFTGHPLGEVIAAMQESVRLAPNAPIYRISLAKGLTMEGDFDAADEQIRQLSRLNRFGNLDLDIEKLQANLAVGRAEASKQQHAVK